MHRSAPGKWLGLCLLWTLLAGQAHAGNRCDKFVYIDDGVFKLDGQPYAMKSVNFRIDIVGKEVPATTPPTSNPRIVVDGKTLDLLIATGGNYSPDNNTWCRDPLEWNPQMRCCSDAATCANDLGRDVDQMLQMGVQSVRLLMDSFKFDGDSPRFSIGRMPWTWNDFRLDMTVPAHRNAVYQMIRQAVQLLGVKGVRSLLLLNARAYYKDRPAQNAHFTTFVSELAAALKAEPFLIGFDFYNEPSWASGAPQGVSFDIDKYQARDLVRGWVNAVRVRGGNNRALLTIGNAFLLASISTWDPFFLPIDFNSYHLYPPAPVVWPSSRSWTAREAYYASLGGCGVKCPYLGTYDGASCHVGSGPVGTQGVVDDDGLFYKGRLDTCPAGARRGDRCLVAAHEVGRDRAFSLGQALYYVKPKGGQCPPGTRSDGANCVVGEAPVGAEAFLWGTGASRAFYYKYLFRTFGGSERCRPPARDDGANCYVAPVPLGHEPFLLSRPMFYVAAVRCGEGRMPYLIGETGFSVHEVNPQTGAVTKPSHGTPQDQASFLRGVAELAHACGHQGFQWWQYGDVKWGDVVQDHFGLWADARQVLPGQTFPPDAMAMRPAGLVLRDLDLVKPRPRCAKPDGFHDVVLPPGEQGSRYRYNGVVVDQRARPVPFALVKGFLAGAKGGEFSLHADGRGRFTFMAPRLVGRLKAMHFGHITSRYHYPVPLVPVVVPIHRVETSELPAYNPPSQNVSACRNVAF